ncbi:TIR domain-containing protein [Desulforhopalus vacuolatus]|uniref:TIR domain-containing protein n=1 Tax=Desulforhopalus vacuolatus TaxID=40414 RepID=UPI0019656A3A|nr:TIR domain-containing protein [Desulforhopalus vacuolatus]MBM9518340.1 TIR domain-containing protein [Desulforhopalus vacuolatus]
MANGLLLGPTIKRKVFVSYHHDGDREFYNNFVNAFSNTYDVISDNSVDRAVDSTNTDYVIRRISENHITGSSCTIVLCGAETPYRKFVDWEIKDTLEKQHGLIGVNLPTNLLNSDSKYTVPDRLHDNIVSGYAVWVNWNEFTQNIQQVKSYIEVANSKSANLINNSSSLMKRNN